MRAGQTSSGTLPGTHHQLHSACRRDRCSAGRPDKVLRSRAGTVAVHLVVGVVLMGQGKPWAGPGEGLPQGCSQLLGPDQCVALIQTVCRWLGQHPA